MVDESHIDDELAQLEQKLANLAPREARLSPGRLMYEAGRSAMQSEMQTRRRGWTWPAATVAMTVAASAFAFMWVTNHEERVVIRTIYVPATAEPAVTPPDPAHMDAKSADMTRGGHAQDESTESRFPALSRPAQGHPPALVSWNGADDAQWLPRYNYLESRQIILAQGLDALPHPQLDETGTHGETQTYQQMRHAMLGDEEGI